MAMLGVPCPECNKPIEDLWEYNCKDGDNEILCPHCDKEVNLHLDISYDYEARKIVKPKKGKDELLPNLEG